MASHVRQGDRVAYDAIKGRYYDTDKAKQAAFRGTVAEDEDLKRGVTIARRGVEESPHARIKNDRRRWIL